MTTSNSSQLALIASQAPLAEMKAQLESKQAMRQIEMQAMSRASQRVIKLGNEIFELNRQIRKAELRNGILPEGY